jgi:hypothetical protein
MILAKGWPMRRIILAIAVAVTGCTAQPQPQSQGYDPQAVMNLLIRRELEKDIQRDEQRRQEETIRLRYQRASNDDLIAEFTRYCPTGKPPCVQSPPDLLIQEASRRGLLTSTSQHPGRPGIESVTMGDDFGGGITECQ